MTYRSTKTFGHNLGLSACFRQWRAHSHCRLLHGYALAIKFVFEADELDERFWVCDFGGFKPLKAILEDTFDHTLLVAEDDPKKHILMELQHHGLARVVIVPATGCEKFAEMIYEVAEQWLKDACYGERVKLIEVEVSEHGANSAIFRRNNNA